MRHTGKERQDLPREAAVVDDDELVAHAGRPFDDAADAFEEQIAGAPGSGGSAAIGRDHDADERISADVVAHAPEAPARLILHGGRSWQPGDVIRERPARRIE